MNYTDNYQLRKPVKGVNVADINDENANMDTIDAILHASQVSLAPAYDEHTTSENPYNTGDIVMYEFLMYKCLEDGVYGIWEPTKWERTTAGEEGGSGGGGNADYVELTQAEYDLLTPQEKMNGKLYFITDGQGEGDAYFYPIIYSTEEREVGVWIDNKPLYSKVFDLGSDVQVSYNSFTDTSIDASDMEKVVDAKGFYSTGVTVYNVIGNINNNIIRLQTDRNGVAASIRYVLLFYTKTTDVAGSGKYNTLGVPTVHYSTDEQIVGTWVDGNTIYQKSISFDNTSSANLSIDVTSLHIDKMIEMKVWNKNTGYQVNTYYDSNTDYINAYFDETGYVHIRRSGTAFAGTGYITIQYTKSQS